MQDQARAQVKLRLPSELHAWLVERAAKNQRSQTGELVWLLQQCREQEQKQRRR